MIYAKPRKGIFDGFQGFVVKLVYSFCLFLSVTNLFFDYNFNSYIGPSITLAALSNYPEFSNNNRPFSTSSKQEEELHRKSNIGREASTWKKQKGFTIRNGNRNKFTSKKRTKNGQSRESLSLRQPKREWNHNQNVEDSEWVKDHLKSFKEDMKAEKEKLLAELDDYLAAKRKVRAFENKDRNENNEALLNNQQFRKHKQERDGLLEVRPRGSTAFSHNKYNQERRTKEEDYDPSASRDTPSKFYSKGDFHEERERRSEFDTEESRDNILNLDNREEDLVNNDYNLDHDEEMETAEQQEYFDNNDEEQHFAGIEDNVVDNNSNSYYDSIEAVDTLKNDFYADEDYQNDMSLHDNLVDDNPSLVHDDYKEREDQAFNFEEQSNENDKFYEDKNYVSKDECNIFYEDPSISGDDMDNNITEDVIRETRYHEEDTNHDYFNDDTLNEENEISEFEPSQNYESLIDGVKKNNFNSALIDDDILATKLEADSTMIFGAIDDNNALQDNDSEQVSFDKTLDSDIEDYLSNDFWGLNLTEEEKEAILSKNIPMYPTDPDMEKDESADNIEDIKSRKASVNKSNFGKNFSFNEMNEKDHIDKNEIYESGFDASENEPNDAFEENYHEQPGGNNHDEILEENKQECDDDIEIARNMISIEDLLNKGPSLRLLVPTLAGMLWALAYSTAAGATSITPTKYTLDPTKLLGHLINLQVANFPLTKTFLTQNNIRPKFYESHSLSLTFPFDPKIMATMFIPILVLLLWDNKHLLPKSLLDQLQWNPSRPKRLTSDDGSLYGNVLVEALQVGIYHMSAITYGLIAIAFPNRFPQLLFVLINSLQCVDVLSDPLYSNSERISGLVALGGFWIMMTYSLGIEDISAAPTRQGVNNMLLTKLWQNKQNTILYVVSGLLYSILGQFATWKHPKSVVDMSFEYSAASLMSNSKTNFDDDTNFYFHDFLDAETDEESFSKRLENEGEFSSNKFTIPRQKGIQGELDRPEVRRKKVSKRKKRTSPTVNLKTNRGKKSSESRKRERINKGTRLRSKRQNLSSKSSKKRSKLVLQRKSKFDTYLKGADMKILMTLFSEQIRYFYHYVAKRPHEAVQCLASLCLASCATAVLYYSDVPLHIVFINTIYATFICVSILFPPIIRLLLQPFIQFQNILLPLITLIIHSRHRKLMS